jgi:hypothetical protein
LAQSTTPSGRLRTDDDQSGTDRFGFERATRRPSHEVPVYLHVGKGASVGVNGGVDGCESPEVVDVECELGRLVPWWGRE